MRNRRSERSPAESRSHQQRFAHLTPYWDPLSRRPRPRSVVDHRRPAFISIRSGLGAGAAGCESRQGVREEWGESLASAAERSKWAGGRTGRSFREVSNRCDDVVCRSSGWSARLSFLWQVRRSVRAASARSTDETDVERPNRYFAR